MSVRSFHTKVVRLRSGFGASANAGSAPRDGPSVACVPDRPDFRPAGRTGPTGQPYVRSEGVGPVAPARLGNPMPVSRSVAGSLADRLYDLLDRILGPLAAPAKPAPVPVPVRTRPPYAGRRGVRR